MGLVAVERLRWGDDWIEPGQPVPEGEDGRDYDWLLRHGHVADVSVAGGEDALRAELARVTAERDELAARVAELETGSADDGSGASDGDQDASGPGSADTGDESLPDGVTDLGGGWYLLADGETKVHGRKALDNALSE